MSDYGKIAILENEVEARMLESILRDMGIPHAIRTYHDFAYDGLFQMQKGWGCVEAELDRKTEVEEVLLSLRKGEEYEGLDVTDEGAP